MAGTALLLGGSQCLCRVAWTPHGCCPNPASCPSVHSLRDTLVSYLDTRESEALPELDAQFPEEIPLASCVAVWKAAAQLKRDRQAR